MDPERGAPAPHPDLPAAETLAQMEAQLPDFVRRDYYTRQPRLSGFGRLLGELAGDPASSDERTKITSQELLEVSRLNQLERILDNTIPRNSDGEGAALSAAFTDLRTKTDIQDPDRGMKCLALAISVRRRTNAAGPDFAPSITQKVGLIRCLHALEQNDTKGLFTQLRSGGGKTSVLLPTLIPVSLLYGKKVDVLSITPKSRKDNVTVFVPMARMLGITVSELTPLSSKTYDVKKHAVMSKPIRLGEVEALTETDVTFAQRENIGHALEFHPDLADRRGKGNRILFQDEFDATDKDTYASSHYAIGGHPLPTSEAISAQWRPLSYPTDRTDNGFDGGYPHQPLFETNAEQVLDWLITSLAREPTQQALVHGVTDLNEFAAVRLMQKFFQHYEAALLRAKAGLPASIDYLGKNGEVLSGGEEDIFRRMWCEATGTAYDEDILLPGYAKRFFETVFPAHIMAGINEAIAQKPNTFNKDGIVMLKDSFTGYPRERTILDTVPQLAVSAWYSLREPVKLPQQVDQFKDMISTGEVVGVMYDKILAFSGTGAESAAWFHMAYDVDTTELPPHFEERFTELPLRISDSLDNKVEELLPACEYFIGNGQTSILIDTTTQQEWQTVRQAVTERYGSTFTIRALRADNASDASDVFAHAGQDHTITVVLMMAGREVDIPVDSGINDNGGYVVLGASPRHTSDNQDQLAYRTSRNGQPGVFLAFSCPDDTVFSVLDHADKEKLKEIARIIQMQNRMRRVLSEGGFITSETGFNREEQRLRSQYLALLDKAVARHEAEIGETNRAVTERVKMFVDIRKKLAHLPQKDRERIMEVWDIFKNTVELQMGMIPMDGTYQTLPIESRFPQYRSRVSELFDHIIRYAKDGTRFRYRAKARIRLFVKGYYGDEVPPVRQPSIW